MASAGLAPALTGAGVLEDARAMKDLARDGSPGPRPASSPQSRAADLERRFAEFVDRHRERSVRLAWRLVGGDPVAAEDVAQDALIRAYRALPRFREEATLETWFYRILVRQASNYRRWRNLRRLWTPEVDPQRFDAPVSGEASRRDPILQRRIAAALAGLTARQREVFVLVHLEGYTVTEAAEILGKPSGTLKSHLHRALKALRSELADVQGEIVAGEEV